MALSKQEQEELAGLEKTVGHLAPAQGGASASSGLTPAEQKELSELESKFGHLAPKPESGVVDKLKHLFSDKGQAEMDKVMADRRAESAKQIANGTTLGQTELEHFANGATFGYLPQLQAGASSLMGDDYVSARDANVRRMQAQSEAHPVNATLGTVAGAAANAYLTPVPGVLKSASAAKGIAGFAREAGTGAVLGGAQGLVQNPGDTPGVVDPIQLSQRLDNAGESAVLGGKIGLGVGAGQAAAQGVRNLAPKLQSAAEKIGFKSTGAMLKDFRQAAGRGPDRVNDLGRFVLDNKLVSAGDTYEDVASKAKAFNEDAGSRLDKIYTDAGKSVKKAAKEISGGPDGWSKLSDAEFEQYKNLGFNPVRDKAKILADARRELGNEVGAKAALGRLESYMDTLAEKYGDRALSPRVANDIKSSMDKAITYSRNPLAKEPEVESAFKAGRSFVADKIDEHVGFLSKYMDNPKAAEELRQANRDYGNSKTVANIATDRASRVAANNAASLTDRIAGGAGAVVAGTAAAASGDHDPGSMAGRALVGGLIAGGANHVIGKYGSSTLARGLDKAAPIVGEIGSVSRALTPSTSMAARTMVSSRSPELTTTQAPAQPEIIPTDKPLKGKDKWANDGLQKLESHGLDIGDVQAAIGNPKIKDLLVKASDLKPGSKAMERIASQIKNMVGEQ